MSSDKDQKTLKNDSWGTVNQRSFRNNKEPANEMEKGWPKWWCYR